MKTGISCTHLVRMYGIEKGFSMIREAGFDSGEFNFSYWLGFGEIVRGETEGNVFTKSDDELRALFRPYLEGSVQTACPITLMHAPFLTLTTKEHTNMDVLLSIQKSIMLTRYLGCDRITIHPAFLDYNDTLPAKEQRLKNLEIFASLIPFLKEYDVMACMENIYTRHDVTLYDAVCNEASEVNDYLDTLNDMAGQRRFGFCLDTGHLILTRNDVYLFLTEIGENLQALHINDNDGERDLHLSPYMGIMDWDRFLRGLTETRYRGCLTFETEPTLGRFGSELTPQCLKLMAATGREFAKRIVKD